MKPPAQVLNRFLIRILRDLPPIDEPVTANGTASGRVVEITAKPEGWTALTIVSEPQLAPSERHSLAIVREAEHPITGYGVWGTLRKRGRNYSLHTVYKALARLTQDGFLHNDHDRSGYIAVRS